VLVQQLLTGANPEALVGELAELFVFAWVEDEGLTVLVPASQRVAAVGDQLLVPSVFRQKACWLIEVYEQQLVVHKCREGDRRDVISQVQKVLGLPVDNFLGPQTKREMQKIATNTWCPAQPEPEPTRLSKWERLMEDD